MKLFSKLLIVLGTLVILSCGNRAGNDPHLTVEEQQEELEINLVGKWKIRRPLTPGLSNKNSIPSECSLNEIEFFDDRSYIISVSVAVEGGEELTSVFRGQYDLLFSEENGVQIVSKVVLMDQDYSPSSSFPETGTVATLDEIELSETEVSFRLQYGPSTAGFCLTGEVVELTGDKEPEVAPDAPANSNHQLIQNEWRLVSVLATIDGAQESQEAICRFFEDDFYNRCFNEETGEFSQDCPQAVSTTLLISGYGTYLFSYYDAQEALISTEQGKWRWRTDTTTPYTIFDVAGGEDSFEDDAQSIEIISLDDARMVLLENGEETDENGATIAVRFEYIFQLASLPYQGQDCGDFTE